MFVEKELLEEDGPLHVVDQWLGFLGHGVTLVSGGLSPANWAVCRGLILHLIEQLMVCCFQLHCSFRPNR